MQSGTVASHPTGDAATAPGAIKVREAAVAGLFYPAGREALGRTVDLLLGEATRQALIREGSGQPAAKRGPLRALICPHAGYVYAGPVAASAYRLLTGQTYGTVVLLAPSHYARLDSASITDAAFFRTPLGDLPISPRARQLAARPPFALQPACLVQRPAWWNQSRRPAPPPGEDTADTWEHSDEVQVPFLQKTLPNAALIPAICGDIDPRKAAAALDSVLDESTLLVVSSDLSHYRPYERAREQDLRAVAAICRLDPEALGDDDACGRIPIRILLHVAKRRGWTASLLDYRNSGDTAGDRSRVVGYAAIAFYEAPEKGETKAVAGENAQGVSNNSLQNSPTKEEAARLSSTHRQLLLEWARLSLSEATATGGTIAVRPESVPEPLRANRGCFVTLTQRDRLRGCIGHIFAQEPLYAAVISNARAAALRDPRFAPVTAAEARDLRIEVSVLTEPVPLAFSSPEDLLSKLRPGRDGVVFIAGQRSSTYLPQVWEQLPDKVDFMNSLAEKAGLPANTWRRPGVRILTYQVEAFHESEAL